MSWALDTNDTRKILWIRGLAGAGKSTLSTTIANRLLETQRLGAFVFFDRDTAERNNPSIVIRTLASQVALFHPSAAREIVKKLKRFPGIRQSSPRNQFQKLLIDAMNDLYSGAEADKEKEVPMDTMVLVLDALDECGTVKTRERLLEVLAEESIRLPPAMRILITSRSEHDIITAFELQPHIFVQEPDITSRANNNDILSYLQQRMVRVRTNARHLSLGDNWPSGNDLRRLAARAEGLFVWASTASEFIDGYDPRKRMEIILGSEVSAGAEYALDELYKIALESSGSWDDEDFVADFTSLVGLVLVARRPLSSTAIDLLLDSPDRKPSLGTISYLGCVLQRGPAVRILHTSFAEFLSTRSRCGRDIWFFDRTVHNSKLARHCIIRLDAVLRRNLCNLTLSADLEHESLPEDVSYACSFWIEHLSTIKGDIPSITERLDGFLSRHLLHWIEAMGILRRTCDIVALMKRLFNWIEMNCPGRKRLLKLVGFAYQFTQTFAEYFEEHPLLVYFTALPFTPLTSTIYQNFHYVHLFPSILGEFYPSQRPIMRAMEDRRQPVKLMAFSPDISRIMTASDENTIRVWDGSSGADVSELRGHDGPVISFAFSPDGRKIISTSSDRTIRVWNAISGAEMRFQTQKSVALSAVFARRGTWIVAGLSDMTVRILDAISGLHHSLYRVYGDTNTIDEITPRLSSVAKNASLIKRRLNAEVDHDCSSDDE